LVLAVAHSAPSDPLAEFKGSYF